MFRPTLANPAQHRTLRPIYAQHQATPYGGFLDPTWDRSKDILPGSVMYRKSAEIFGLYTTAVAGSGAKPFGLSALFCAPALGIDEVTATGTNLFTVWVGGEQAVFEVLAPAFDPAIGAATTTGTVVLLTANTNGLLTTAGATNANSIAELLDVESADKILIRLNKFSPGAWTLGGS